MDQVWEEEVKPALLLSCVLCAFSPPAASSYGPSARLAGTGYRAPPAGLPALHLPGVTPGLPGVTWDLSSTARSSKHQWLRNLASLVPVPFIVHRCLPWLLNVNLETKKFFMYLFYRRYRFVCVYVCGAHLVLTVLERACLLDRNLCSWRGVLSVKCDH